MNEHPRTPVATPPDDAEWAAATRDAMLGRYLTLRWRHRDITVPVLVTATFDKAWRATRMSVQERSDVRAACLHIARRRVHPALGIQPVPAALGEGFMATPTLGWTATWMTHPSRDLPLFLTLTHTP